MSTSRTSRLATSSVLPVLPSSHNASRLVPGHSSARKAEKLFPSVSLAAPADQAPDPDRHAPAARKSINFEMLTHNERIARQAMRLPLCEPKDLQKCEEGCHWRWLVHTLLGDVAIFKHGLDETNELLQHREDRRRELEEAAIWRSQVTQESNALRSSLSELEQNFPKLEANVQELSDEASFQQQKKQELEAYRDQLKVSLKSRSAQVSNLEATVRASSNHESTKAAEELGRKLYRLRGEIESASAELHGLIRTRDQFKENAAKEGMSLEYKQANEEPVSPKRKILARGLTKPADQMLDDG